MMFDTQALLDRVGGRQELLQDMIELFLSTQPQRMQELRRVSDDRNMERLSRLAHTLAGSFSTMSMDLAALLAREIQRHASGDEPVAAQSAVARLEQVFEQLLQQLRTPATSQAAPVQVRSNDQHGS
jgi:HPt (histidine-containing phosphotransfer) domain-containing protein